MTSLLCETNVQELLNLPREAFYHSVMLEDPFETGKGRKIDILSDSSPRCDNV